MTPTGDLVSLLEREGLLRAVTGALPWRVAGVSDDSRAITSGDTFVAVRGLAADGHSFIAAATARGASMAVVEREADWPLPTIRVTDAKRAGILLADAAYARPLDSLRVAAVTGTNGKSTTVHLARVVLDAAGGSAASIGTLGVLHGREGTPLPGGAGLTTPGAIELRRVARRLLDAGVGCAAMEVSSHSLTQGRVDGLTFPVAAFTTFSRDHLDYHGSMDEYFNAKARLLDHVSRDGTVVLNDDDPAWRRLPASRRVVTYAVGRAAQVRAHPVRAEPRGSSFTLTIGDESADVRLPLVGDFNVGNALAAAAIAHVMGANVEGIARALTSAPQMPGRLEVLADSPLVLRDYAHTPDALERSLTSTRQLTGERLVLVFGCGGDRDRGKRAQMGAVAARLADSVVVTSDNPRTEEPEAIINDIVAGMPGGSFERHEDRRVAIRRALELASPRDVVLIAGKGHETYQIRGTVAYPFDEKQIVGELLAAAGL
ncbi:MAG TPA: UDP-N-acetylmuramoyl-L-alanyl-D-glutamate--2,6-diaminopimelate ligase [Gemmatimonadaceae bacterium]|nr:UDP-N-acetylmuramoyl-L-alanyl-D-glutamate--2,6-diaminopimelate ligase [Gemmatimonadaceae bacterium]